ncbi:MAG: DUF6106 family protein [Clostridia bacterium]|nr:DUF6106 family protein [Clostridia bacterium]
MDFFNEWIVKKKKNIQDIMSIIIIFFTALLFLYLVLVQLGAGKVVFLIPVEIALIAYVAYYLWSSLNVEFEYSVTNGDLDIDKIVAKKRRKKLVRIKLKDIEYFAPLDDNHINVAEDPSVDKVIDASSDIDSPKVYFAIYFNNSEKVCLLFEPTDKMIENFADYIPRSLNHTL